MACLLSQQDDFTNQPSMLEDVITKAGHACLFLPKFHCELNPIEQVWGAAKRVYREFPMSSTEADLRQNLLASLNSVKLLSIRR